MSAIANFSINLDKIPEDAIVKGEKGRYVNMTAFINDETKYGNNVSIQKPKSKEEREAGVESVFYGNGKVSFVSDTGVSVAEKTEDLPF